MYSGTFFLGRLQVKSLLTDYNITLTLISQAFRLGTSLRSFHLKELDSRIRNPRV